ncbi:MAG: hypothetical protein ACK5NT_14285 [Pyrinomonadaceae bacterium]
MNRMFYLSNGTTISLGEELGRGGEGAVFEILGKSESVAKIYHEAVSKEKAEKLRFMRGNKNERLLSISAWVTETVHDETGNIIGCVLPRVDAKEIHNLYSVKSRKIYFPTATWEFLVHTAANIARAFYTMHAAEQILGDVNHGNCVVKKDGTVMLIDCDSFAINTGEKRFPCGVGVGTHLAPELQGTDLHLVEREKSHDEFGLAVLIFQMLFLGRHPFAGIGEQTAELSLEECIASHRFAYGKNANNFELQSPPGTLLLSDLPPEIALYFEHAFDVQNKRPSAADWILALDDLRANLVTCETHPGHQYFAGCKLCPWCRIEAETGLMLFPFVLAENERISGGSLSNVSLDSMLKELEKQQQTDLVTKQEKSELWASKEALQAKQSLNRLMAAITAVLIFVNLIVANLIGFSSITFAVLSTFVFLIIAETLYTNPRGHLKTKILELQLEEAELNKAHKELSATYDVKPEIAEIRRLKSKLRKPRFTKSNTKPLALGNMSSRQFLECHLIEDATFDFTPNIDRQQLINSGVISAADINESRLSHDLNLSSKVVEYLVSWRRKIQRSFDSLKLADNELLALEQEREQIENTYKQTAIRVDSLLIVAKKKNFERHTVAKQLSAKWNANRTSLEKRKLDLETLGDYKKYLIILLPFLFITPFAFIRANHNSQPAYKNRPIQTDEVNGIPKFQINDEYGNPLPNYNTSQQEMEQMSIDQREHISFLITQDIEARRGPDDKIAFGDKIKWLEFAERLSANEKVWRELGIANYFHGNYQNSKRYFEKVLRKGNNYSDYEIRLYATNCDYYLGNNEQAEDELWKITQEYPKGWEARFTLALLYRDTKRDRLSVNQFIKVVDLNPTDTEGYRQLLLGLWRLDNRMEFAIYYEKFAQLDLDAAEDTLRDTYKTLPDS